MHPTTSRYLLKDSLGHLATQFSKAVLRRINLEFEAAGHAVTGEQWTALVHIWDAEGLTQQELGQRIVKDKTTIARLVAGLERQGYVRRRPGASDRRERLLALSERGRADMPHLAALVQGVLDKACAGIDAHELCLCRRVLARARQNLAALKS